MPDIVEKYYNSSIHHGKDSDRIYLMSLDKLKVEDTLNYINQLASTKEYSKIFAKVSSIHSAFFEKHGFIKETLIPNFYKGKEDACFLAKYPFQEKHRHILKNKELIDSILLACKEKAKISKIDLSDNYNFEILKENDIAQITGLYRKVFKTYPFPIFEDDYILQTMKENICYFGIKKQGKLVAVSSAEMDKNNLNAEMTDFATLSECRGENLSTYLLYRMEEYIKNIGFKTAYTIARSVSYGMNITFSKCSYVFAGTLVNNTDIAGSIESMNVWYKNL